MMSVIKRDFVTRRSSSLQHIPADWTVGPGRFYQLDFKMCQIESLRYNFEWSNSIYSDSVIGNPHKVLMLNLALNNLTELRHDGLAHFKQLRALDASLNRINRYHGVEVLHRLYSLNLSHNHITNIEPGLQACRCLYELNLAMNKISDISIMPSINTLCILHLNNNQLTNLDGVQSLSHLKELYVHRNQITSLLPLASNLRLRVLQASDNQITSFYTTLQTLKDLKRLQVLCLFGNPIEKENNYQSQLLHSTSIDMLDNISIRTHPRPQEGYFGGNLRTIRDSTIQAFHDQMHEQRQQMEKNVQFMQHRLKALQDGYTDYESRMHRDLENCLRHLDNLTVDELDRYDVPTLRERLRTPIQNPWEQSNWLPPDHERRLPKHQNNELPYKRPHHRQKEDFRHIKDTDEVLRHVYNELNVVDQPEIPN